MMLVFSLSCSDNSHKNNKPSITPEDFDKFVIHDGKPFNTSYDLTSEELALLKNAVYHPERKKRGYTKGEHLAKAYLKDGSTRTVIIGLAFPIMWIEDTPGYWDISNGFHDHVMAIIKYVFIPERLKHEDLPPPDYLHDDRYQIIAKHLKGTVRSTSSAPAHK